jgi:hypothetical protein
MISVARFIVGVLFCEHCRFGPGIGDSPFELADAYGAASATIAKEHIVLAGARIANLLNEAFR